MALIVETGTGIREANAYTDVAYVTSYLTARNRQTENGWDNATTEAKEAAVIAATDYIDTRFGARFRGVQSFTFTDEKAKAELLFSGLPDPADELTLGDDVYKFVVSLSGEAYEVLIGASGAATASNLEAAIMAGPGAGVTYGLGTPQSRHSTAKAAGAVLTLTAKAAGAGGNLSVLRGPIENVTITGFSGGRDGGIQPLAWPRSNAYDQQGNLIQGIPDRLRQVVAEYAVRAVASVLLPDPAVDPYGGKLYSRAEQVGPIREEARYSRMTGSSDVFVPYPAADRLIRPLLLGSGGGVIRG